MKKRNRSNVTFVMLPLVKGHFWKIISIVIMKNHTNVTNAPTAVLQQVIFKDTKSPTPRRRLSSAMIATKLSNVKGTWSDTVSNTLVQNRFSFVRLKKN